MFKIEWFETDDGKKPARDFLLSLDPKMRVKIIRNLKHLQENGPGLREPLSSPLGDKLFELRTQTGGNITRMLYFFYAGQTIIVTHGFTKKTQKTPAAEIKRARQYRQIYLERKKAAKDG
ncbi:MAG: type II toxin-antitoxin system RelE/ParE family toxin [Schwartzia sp.]|nr:type II toxin-antitoxin system RelE/ParE family toxin [Schwartzia sp. (in: firmicutes)]